MRRSISVELLINRFSKAEETWEDLDVTAIAYVEKDEEGGYYFESVKLFDDNGRKVRVTGDDEHLRVKEALTDAYEAYDPDEEDTEVDE